MRKRKLALILVLLLAFSAFSPLAYADFDLKVRVEGKTGQLLNETVSVSDTDTAKDALIRALPNGVADISTGTFITRIADEEIQWDDGNGGYWGIFERVDGQVSAASEGADTLKVQNKEELIFHAVSAKNTLEVPLLKTSEQGNETELYLYYMDGSNEIFIEDATLKVNGSTYTTNAEGKVSVALDAGTYDVQAFKETDGYPDIFRETFSVKVLAPKTGDSIRVRVVGESDVIFDENYDIRDEDKIIEVLKAAVGAENIVGDGYVTSILGESSKTDHGWSYYMTFSNDQINPLPGGADTESIYKDSVLNYKDVTFYYSYYTYISPVFTMYTKIPQIEVTNTLNQFTVQVTSTDAGNPTQEEVDVKVEKNGSEIGIYKTNSSGVANFTLNQDGEYKLTLSKYVDGKPYLVKTSYTIEHTGSNKTAEIEVAFDKVLGYVRSQGGAAWDAFTVLAHNAVSDDSDDFTTFKENVSDNVSAYGENIIGMLATGQSCKAEVKKLAVTQEVDGAFVKGGSDKESATNQAIAILALDLAGAMYDVEGAIKHLVSLKQSSGHYDTHDANGIVLYALSRHTGIDGVNTVISAITDHTKSEQMSNGGLDYCGLGNSTYCTGPIIVGLLESGENLFAGEWLRNDNGLYDAVVRCVMTDGQVDMVEGCSDPDPTATAFGFQALCQITTSDSIFKSFEVEGSYGLELGDSPFPVVKNNTYNFTAKASDQYGNASTKAEMIWSSSDESVLRIEDSGEAQAEKSGEVTIIGKLKSDTNKEITQTVYVFESDEDATALGQVSSLRTYYLNQLKFSKSEALGFIHSSLDKDVDYENVFDHIQLISEPSGAGDYVNNIISLISAGKSPYFYGGRKQVSELITLVDGSIDAIPDNLLWWSIIALDMSEANYPKEIYLNKLVSKQQDDGGFMYGVDGTGTSLVALSQHRDITGVSDAIDKAVVYLAEQQLSTGGFADSYSNEENSCSLAMAIQGLNAVGEDLTQTKWESSKGESLYDVVLKYKTVGTYKWKHTDSSDNSYATSQLFGALSEIASGNSMYKTVKVNPAAIAQKSIVIDSLDSYLVQVGDRYSLSAKIYNGTGNEVQENITWTSSKPEVATIDSNGSLEILIEGETLIKVALESDDKVYSTLAITVKSGASPYKGQKVKLRIEGKNQTYYDKEVTVSNETTAFELLANNVDQNLIGGSFGDYGFWIQSLYDEKPVYPEYWGFFTRSDNKLVSASSGVSSTNLENIDEVLLHYKGETTGLSTLTYEKKDDKMEFILKKNWIEYDQDYNQISKESFVSDATLKIGWKTYLTDNEGKVSIALEDGTYDVLVYKDGLDYPGLIRNTFAVKIGENGGTGGGDVSNDSTVSLIVKGHNGRTILSESNIVIADQEDALTLTQRILSNQGIDIKQRDGYVYEIAGDKEHEYGATSGWMINVSGNWLESYAGSYKLKNNDSINWLYTDDGGLDIGAKHPVTLGGGGVIPTKPPAEQIKEMAVYEEKIPQSGIIPNILNTDERMDKEEVAELKKELEANKVKLAQKISLKEETLISDAKAEVALLIPEKALKEVKEITVKELKPSETPKNFAVKLGSSVYEFGPDGTKFDKKVTISLKVAIDEKADLDNLTVAWYDEEKEEWVPVPSVIDLKNGVVTIQIDHFTKFALIEKASRKTFEDVNDDVAWAKDAIEILAGKKIINGTEKGFEPQRSITRAEFVTLIVKALELKQDTSSVSMFEDVKFSDWYADNVDIAFDNKIISGGADGNFRPNDPISRNEIAAIFYRLENVDSQKLSTYTMNVSDQTEIPTWAWNGVKYVVNEKLMVGYEDGSFNGTKALTRAEAAFVLFKYLNEFID